MCSGDTPNTTPPAGLKVWMRPSPSKVITGFTAVSSTARVVARLSARRRSVALRSVMSREMPR